MSLRFQPAWPWGGLQLQVDEKKKKTHSGAVQASGLLGSCICSLRWLEGDSAQTLWRHTRNRSNVSYCIINCLGIEMLYTKGKWQQNILI